MRLRIYFLSFFFALAAVWAQAPTIQSTDPINLRNIALSNDGTEVVYAAALNRFARTEGVTNLYSTVLTPVPIATRLTSYEGNDNLSGVMALDLAATGRIVYTLLSDFIN